MANAKASANCSASSNVHAAHDHYVKRARRRRRRRGGGYRRDTDKDTVEAHWWSYAPRPTNDDGEKFEPGKLGYPVVLPSGQSVFLLHEAKNPEYAQTFLAEDKYRPAMPSPPSAITEDSIQPSPEKVDGVDFLLASGSDVPSYSTGPSLCHTNVDDDSEELWDDVDDAMSTCSELSAVSTGMLECACPPSSASPAFRNTPFCDTRISSIESDLGSTDASDSSSLGASSATWSSSSTVSSSGNWTSTAAWTFHVFVAIPMPEQAHDRASEDDASFLVQYSDEVDRLTQDASETNESTDALASRQARKEGKRLRKLNEAEERKAALKARRRAEHEKRERRNKVKQQRRETTKATSAKPFLDEVDLALKELGLSQ